MIEDMPIPNNLTPIERLTPEDRMAIFDRQSTSIYNKYSVYGPSGPGRLIGGHQPFVYITVASSNARKNITSHDSQALPFGSTILDVERVTKFAASGDGLLFIGKQYLLQRQNAFNETRIYNPISLISATAAKGSTGLIERPTRFLATGGGGFTDFAASSLLSFIGVQSSAISNPPSGTATGAGRAGPALSGYVTVAGSQTNRGLLRYETGDRARSNFLTYFPAGGSSGKESLGQSLGKVLINKLKSFIPSTMPFLSIGGTDQKWPNRPEYTEETNGAYEKYLTDVQGLLSVNNTAPRPRTQSSGFLNTITTSLRNAFLGGSQRRNLDVGGPNLIKVDKFHLYKAGDDKTKYYYNEGNTETLDLIKAGTRAVDDATIHNTSIPKQLEKTQTSTTSFDKRNNPQGNRHTQMYKILEDLNPNSDVTYKSYQDIPGTSDSPASEEIEKFYYGDGDTGNLEKIDSGTRETGNSKNISIPQQLENLKNAAEAWNKDDTPQKRKYTQMYTTLEDLKNPDITYPAYSDIPDDDPDQEFEGKIEGPTVDGRNKLGKGLAKSGRYDTANKELSADSLYADEINKLDVLKNKDRDEVPDELSLPDGQSKDIIFLHFFDLVNNTYIPFRATLNGFNEVHTPDWEAIQYIGRADKLYLYKGFERSCNFNFTVYASSLEELVPMWKRINYLVGLTRPSGYTKSIGGGVTKEFMIPPMVTLRLGDIYNDQPGVLTTVGVTVPDDALWESYRGKGDSYNYLKGIVDINYDADVVSLQLPMKVDININMNLMEKARSVVGDDHYNVINHEFASS